MRAVRHSVQFWTLALVLVAVFAIKGNAEWWCPFGGVEAIYTYLSEGSMPCSLAVSNFYILAAVLAMTVLMRRAFCGYLCPIGALSEWLGHGARYLKVPFFRVCGKKDRVLSLLKYALLAIILFITYRAGELLFRGFDPCYALISRHGEDITFWAYAVAAAVAVGSLFTAVPFCRWLCPLAAVLNPFSRFALARVRRDEEKCSGCGKCAKACPMAIPVDKVSQVTHARCLSCMNCLESCRKDGSLAWGPPQALGKSRGQATLVNTMLLCVCIAALAYHFFPLPSFIKVRGELPQQAKTIELRIKGLKCRGSANLLAYYLHRDDFSAIEGYLKIEAWPQAGFAKAVISYDSKVADEKAIKQAITEPYFDRTANIWRNSPFEIEGYDPLDLDGIFDD